MLEYKKALELVKQKDNLIKQKNEELKQKNEELKQKNEALKSASYRIGRIITWPMRKIL
jgi:FtsZ-binding cell division protein ZapB